MRRAGQQDDEPVYEEIGGGLIEDRPSALHSADPLRLEGRSRSAGGTGSGHVAGVGATGGEGDSGEEEADRPRLSLTGTALGVLTAAVAEWRAAARSIRFWLGVAAGILAPVAAATGLTLLAMAGYWFEEGGPWIGGVTIFAMCVPLSAAVLGTIWGFGQPRTADAAGTAARIAAAGLKGLVFGAIAGFAILVAGTVAGVLPGSQNGGQQAGTAGLAGAAAVVIFLEVLLFAALGAGARMLFRSPVPGGLLAGVLVLLLCVANGVLAGVLLPGTFGTERVSVPVNISRDANGRVVSYECVGEPVRFRMVLHSERVVWLAAPNPVLIFGSIAAGTAPADNEIAWILPSIQTAFEGPARDVPCINGAASDEIQPAPPLWLVGFAGQAAIAALVLVPACRLSARRQAARQDP